MRMTLKEKLQKAWDNRAQIAEGLYNTYISHSQEIKDEAARRRSICQSNECGLYDVEGITEKVVVKGKESCAGCGCTLELKTHCMSCDCYLKDIGQEPRWIAILTREQENEIKDKEYHNQFKK